MGRQTRKSQVPELGAGAWGQRGEAQILVCVWGGGLVAIKGLIQNVPLDGQDP